MKTEFFSTNQNLILLLSKCNGHLLFLPVQNILLHLLLAEVVMGEELSPLLPSVYLFWHEPHPCPHLKSRPVTQTQPDMEVCFLLATEIG